jgi:hypothetical protein
MSISYTNRKGITYYLCRGVAKSGKPRYYFARTPWDEPVAELPEGHIISESVNGVVSLTKARPSQILPAEVAAVEAELRKHPKGHRYRVDAKQNRLTIYERSSPDVEETLALLKLPFAPSRERIDELRADMDRRARFNPVLRFILADTAQRTFRTERMCYLGSIDDWINVFVTGPIERLAQEVLPRLGNDEFFELF